MSLTDFFTPSSLNSREPSSLRTDAESLTLTVSSPARVENVSATEPLSTSASVLTSSLNDRTRRCCRLSSVSAKQMASRMFDLPLPFGPVMHVKCGQNATSVAFANDLKPCSRTSSSSITTS